MTTYALPSLAFQRNMLWTKPLPAMFCWGQR